MRFFCSLVATFLCLFAYTDMVSRAAGIHKMHIRHSRPRSQNPFVPGGPDTLPAFVDDDRNLKLPAVAGAKVQLFAFRPQSGLEPVVVPAYVDEWFDVADIDRIRDIKRAVVHTHGQIRDGWAAWKDAADARAKLDEATQRSVVIVVPQFFNGSDKDIYHGTGPGSTGNLLVWDLNGWGEGAVNQLPESDTSVSSFEVLDTLGRYLTDPDLFPRVEHITYSGHSLGGQLTHRYSILGDAEPAHGSTATVSFVTIDPATSLYFSAERKGPPCAGMNEYKYGFDKLDEHFPTYSTVRGALRDFYQFRYLNQRSSHLIHAGNDHGQGDSRCWAMAQGKDRVERAQNYHDHLRQIVDTMYPFLPRPREPLDNTTDTKGPYQIGQVTVDWVAGVAHNGAAMVGSLPGRQRIFLDN
ncbi:uncharacterized protein PFL1_02111 [Pseudozyma flocculosa PF-1]|uniref:AB hydrolase-1 domain-containing protein n=1 Tax=Pseudozyma flocculosa TaxID=84751 RepID=A0A5C3F040_9BASI|nr:uncharacterized protein PFL1_02111 [Pseudozyma flocculosa PF-1]EPQ30587.1 hypothetical protein PFL1_02111 [Pseudozyma flocculosa PF-1]SPO37682.1 uncharacterized protein PSFLO_03158 [Pseudozyma flocculosa]